MRKEFIRCKDRRTAKRRCPWAEYIIKADSGFWCFESYYAARNWIFQEGCKPVPWWENQI